MLLLEVVVLDRSTVGRGKPSFLINARKTFDRSSYQSVVSPYNVSRSIVCGLL